MQTAISKSQDIDPAEWDAFIHRSPQGMIYMKHGYMSVIAPGWQAAIVRGQEGILGVLPFWPRKKMGQLYCMQPLLSQYWGICLAPPIGKRCTAFDTRKQLINALLQALPDFKLFHTHLSPAFDYPLPLIWQNYKLQPRYTYQVDLSQGADEVWSQMSNNIRRDIRKFEKNGFVLEETSDTKAVVEMFARAKATEVGDKKIKSLDKLTEIYKQYAPTGECYIMLAKTQDGATAGGMVFYNFNDTAIYYFSGIEPAYKQSGASSALIWESMQRAIRNGMRTFDFEGSMIESVENFFRGFGAVPVPYLQATRRRFPLTLLK